MKMTHFEKRMRRLDKILWIFSDGRSLVLEYAYFALKIDHFENLDQFKSESVNVNRGLISHILLKMGLCM